MHKIIIDPGHGGSETGAAANGYLEKNLNLELSNYLKAELERCGIEVIMTRTGDTNPSLYERGIMAINENALCFLSIHFNSFNKLAKGFEAIYTITPQEQRNSSQWIGNCISEEVAKLGVFQRGIWTKESGTNPGNNYYGVLRSSQSKPALILEGLFLDNLQDIEFLKQPDFLKKLSISYARGLCSAYGFGYVEEVVKVETPVKTPETIMEYLVRKGFTKSLHLGSETLTMEVFGQMMKNYFGE